MKNEAKEILENAGLKADRFGNYQVKGTSKTFRFKLQDRSFRLERKVGSQWYSCVDGRVLYYSKYNSKLLTFVNKAKELSNK